MLDDSAGSLGPDCTTFVILSFEGPDPYARAGGLGVRVSELSLSLAAAGYEVHLVFVGDPSLPSEETREDGRLLLHRWCQWISAYHPEGVYAGEEGKWRDFTDSVPTFVLDRLAPGAFAAGRRLVILGEEWHTAEAMCRIGDGLWASGQRDQAVLLWNANNTMGFDRINWPRLNVATTITTVSRYMKHLLWGYACHMENAVVLDTADPAEAAWYVGCLGDRPHEQQRLRSGARKTAAFRVGVRARAVARASPGIGHRPTLSAYGY